jgi:hypothetical protein
LPSLSLEIRAFKSCICSLFHKQNLFTFLDGIHNVCSDYCRIQIINNNGSNPLKIALQAVLEDKVWFTNVLIIIHVFTRQRFFRHPILPIIYGFRNIYINAAEDFRHLAIDLLNNQRELSSSKESFVAAVKIATTTHRSGPSVEMVSQTIYMFFR